MSPAARGADAAGDPVLTVDGLRVSFATRRGPAHVVNGVSWSVAPGETLAIVGESGSGKSVSVMALLGLLPRPPATVTGEVRFGGRDLLALSEDELRGVRGPGVGMVFQDPMTSLNPVLTVGRQLTEGMEAHLGLDRRAADERAVELLDLVGIPAARDRLASYPHQLSGGMRQRVMIAIALSCSPDVLVADEATTALDVTVEAQIVELVARLQGELGMAVVWITHDLGVVAGIADRVAVMYAGRIVEEAPVDRLYAAPHHPYTRGLMASLPRLGAGAGHRPADLATIRGLPPDPVALPAGCAFWPRCPVRGDERCATEAPSLRPIGDGDRDGDRDRDGQPGPEHRVATFYDPPAAHPGDAGAAAGGTAR